MTNDQLEKLRQILADFYKVIYWADPFNADEFMKKKIEELGGRVEFPVRKRTFKFLKTLEGTTGYHQDDTGIYIMHTHYACCILDEDLANKILLLGLS